MLKVYWHIFLEWYYTGWFKSVIDTLPGYYDKYTVCTKKIIVNFFSIYRDILFYNNKLGKIAVHTVKIWIGNLMWFLPQNSTYNFEAVWGQYGLKSLTLGQSHLKITYNCNFILVYLEYGLGFI